ncbi:hypothetical protein [Halosegnis rubeus]|uniref:Peptidase M50B-like n=1 Tax=Halosegnis rubeus TaxID=2212850 RepID=A0A5N5UJ74_9EURY|nr:hypothetical protein [Halosegnis rubeus]KAB7518784.1 hypothetical protein DP108_06350 [Halosegnis rubeus]
MPALVRLFGVLARLATAPPTLAHEASHAAAARLAGASPSWTRVGRWQPAIRVDWSDTTHGEPAGRAAALVALAPTLAGLAALVVGVVGWLAAGGGLPESSRTLLVCAIAAAWYGNFVLPSGGDVAAARAALRRGRDGSGRS